jgi:hypothetical protein
MGNYGGHGNEWIRVSYSSDCLEAYKVTGDTNVPRGQLSFSVNFSQTPKLTIGNSQTVISHSTELKNGIIYMGTALISRQNFESPTYIDCDCDCRLT